MPVNTNTNFIQQTNKPANQPIFLYTLYNYDGAGTNICYAEYDQDVVYQSSNDAAPVTYAAFPLNHDQIGENITGQMDSVKITCSNVSRLIQAYLELYEFRGLKISVKQVWADQLSDPDAFLEHIFYIDSWQADQNNVIFTCSSKMDVLVVQLPGRLYSRTTCAWAPRFKGVECKYSGTGTTCDGTLNQCRIYNNVINYGGQPAVPSEKIYG